MITFIQDNKDVSSVTLRNTKLDDAAVGKLRGVLKSNSAVKVSSVSLTLFQILYNRPLNDLVGYVFE